MKEYNYYHAYIAAMEREKYWQEKAGRMAVIANRMYHWVDERKLSGNEINEAHEMYQEILDMLAFDEDC